MFEFETISHRGPAMEVDYHICPWDRPILGVETAAIAALTLHDAAAAGEEFQVFRSWCGSRDVRLVSSRLPHDDLAAIGFLESQGFRFIELNYHPKSNGLAAYRADDAVSIVSTGVDERDELIALAGKMFDYGRLHADPMVGARLGNLRYAAWLRNAFVAPHQDVLAFVVEGRKVGFVVVESPSPVARFWSLIGISSEHRGRGLGRRIWRSLLAYHHAEGVEEVSTSISSLNTPVLNLYASLGFRFPAPTATLHWCPAGRLES
jgi:ribosomal protein S18 acetylase RimI-like enzyme